MLRAVRSAGRIYRSSRRSLCSKGDVFFEELLGVTMQKNSAARSEQLNSQTPKTEALKTFGIEPEKFRDATQLLFNSPGKKNVPKFEEEDEDDDYTKNPNVKVYSLEEFAETLKGTEKIEFKAYLMQKQKEIEEEEAATPSTISIDDYFFDLCVEEDKPIQTKKK